MKTIFRLHVIAVLLVVCAALTSSAGAQTAGSLDTLDVAIPTGSTQVNALAWQPDGKLIIGGTFTTMLGSTRNRIARLNADGTLDTGFNPNAGNSVTTVIVQPDGKLIVAGLFSTIGGASHGTIARLNADGTADSTYTASTNLYTACVALQSDGKMIVGGSFSSMNGTARSNIGRLNADGTLDTSFNPGASAYVGSIAVQPDGKILVGGQFTIIAGTARNRIARLNADGTIDSTFDPNANNEVRVVALQADGKILLGGNFTTLQPNGAASATTRNRLARLNTDGTLDTGFDPNASGQIQSLAVQADGRIIVGGEFTSIVSTTRNRIARLKADGTLDSGFNPNANNWVYAIALQPDGKLAIGGTFTTLQPNGAASATTRNYFARLLNDAATQALSAPDITQVLWQRGGASPELSLVTFEQSTNGGASWTFLGSGTRVGTTANWQLTGLGLPVSGTFQLRARGRITNGYQNSGLGLAETIITTQITGVIAVEQPAGSSLTSGVSSVDFGGIPLGAAGTALTFTVKNVGNANLSVFTPTLSGTNSAEFTLNTGGMAATLNIGAQTTFSVTFAPATGNGITGSRSATVTIPSSDLDTPSFTVALSGTALSYTTDTDSDGMNDAAEFLNSALGFNWQTAQPALVSTYYNHANAANFYSQTQYNNNRTAGQNDVTSAPATFNLFTLTQYNANRTAGQNDVINSPNTYSLYTTNQVQAVNVSLPQFQRDNTGTFTLTVGVQKATDLIHFNAFPFTAPQMSVDGQGRVQVQFTVPDNAAFFKVQAQ